MVKHVKRIIIAVSVFIACLILAGCVYLIYLAASYSRMDDNLPLAVKNNASETPKGGQFKIVTFNIGFGANDSEFSLFTQRSEVVGGGKRKGKYGRAKSKEEVRKNTDAMASTVELNNYDFALLQEVDENGDRSRNVDQRNMFERKMSNYASVYAKNLHSSYLYYPFNDPYGKNASGLLTLSKYKVDRAERKKLPAPNGFSKYYDLDYCFSVSRFAIGDKELTLVNLQLSPYDDCGEEQLDVLFEFMSAEYANGNYVIVGGDFEHDLSGCKFPTEELEPKWACALPELPDGFVSAVAKNGDEVPTRRSSATAYEKGKNFVATVDGFIVSDNVIVDEVVNIDMDFELSDHNPVQMRFTLEGL